MKNLDFAVNALDSVFDYVRTLNEIDYKSFKIRDINEIHLCSFNFHRSIRLKH